MTDFLLATILIKVKTALAELDLPLGMGTLLMETGGLPEYYLVYQLITGVPGQHADDEEQERNYRIQVTHWSRSGLADLVDVDGAMKAIGGIKGTEAPQPRDTASGHYGLAVDYIFQATVEPEGS